MGKIIKIALAAVAVAAGVLLAGCKLDESKGLYELEKPYAGIYVLESMMVNGEEIAEDFLDGSIELTAKNEVVFKSRQKGERLKERARTKYRIDKNRIYIDGQPEKSVFLDKGVLTVEYTAGGKNITAKYKQ